MPILFGKPQHLICRLPRLEALRRLDIPRSNIGMVFLGKPPPRMADHFEIGIRLEIEHVERPHLVAATAAVAGPCPAMMF